MKQKLEICAIIPARGGSKGIVDKNIREFNGKPLVVWSIEQALCASGVNRVIVSTDSPEIARVSLKAGAEVPSLRPADLAEDQTPTEPVLVHAVENWCISRRPDVVMLLQPTSPLRLSNSIDAAIKRYVDLAADSLVSVTANHSFFWKNRMNPQALYDYRNRPRRQDIHPDDMQYRETGSIYMTRTDTLLETNNRLGGKIAIFEMEEIESLEIDSELDFKLIETLMRLTS